MLSLLATVCAGLFSGAAIYVNLVEHPARLSCGTELAVKEFGMLNEIDEDSGATRSEEHTSELQSLAYLVCRLLLEKKKDSKPQLDIPCSRHRCQGLTATARDIPMPRVCTPTVAASAPPTHTTVRASYHAPSTPAVL